MTSDNQKLFNKSVGLVQTQTLKITLPPEGFVLKSGACLPELQVAYETYGTISPRRDNVVYICHALTGDAHAAGYHAETDRKPGWWDAMIGPGKGIDTDRFYVVCANILGGCMGTTGPGSLDPRTGRPYGSAFPKITTEDIVHVQYLLLKQLGVKRLAAVIGGSFGGMQTLAWITRYPQMVGKCVCIASAMNLSAQALAFDIVGRHAIVSDPDWLEGDYYAEEKKPSHGLAQARMLGHITYLSSENMKRKFGREKRDNSRPSGRFATPFQIESYLDYQGTKFVNRFDANSYLHITEAMDVFDLTENHPSAAAAFATVDPETRSLVVALSSDWLFPPEQSLAVAQALSQAGKHVSYCLLRSPYGHDAFLVEIERLAEVMKAFLESDKKLAQAGTLADKSDDPNASQSVPMTKKVRSWRSEQRWIGDDSGGREYRLIKSGVRPGSRVLDLGCGDGSLLQMLAEARNVSGLGMDINIENVLSVLEKGLDVFQCDLDEGLHMITDYAYDYAVLSQTLQVVRKPKFVLNEMLRVAKAGIVSFPNFGNWHVRARLMLTGRMPVSPSLPFAWHDTPNIHLFTLKDFKKLCAQEGIEILNVFCTAHAKLDTALLKLGQQNLGADQVIATVTRKN